MLHEKAFCRQKVTVHSPAVPKIWLVSPTSQCSEGIQLSVERKCEKIEQFVYCVHNSDQEFAL